jgi:hypothetical protein
MLGPDSSTANANDARWLGQFCGISGGSIMRTFSHLLIICGTLFALVLGFHRDASTTLAAPPLLSIDANRRLTSAPIFTPGEKVAFWYDVVTGGAGSFAVSSVFDTTTVKADGTLDVTLRESDWRLIPKTATALVAHGLSSGVDAVLPLQVPADLDLALHIDANRRISSGPVFTPSERVIFWYNLPDGSAVPFLTEGFQAVNARGDGTIEITIPAVDWRLPAEATSVVAHGLSSNVTIVYIAPTK